MSRPLALEISGLTVRHGATVAVDRVDLRIPAGETVALLGPVLVAFTAGFAALAPAVSRRRPMYAVAG